MMAIFFVCIIFVGSVLVILSIFLMLYEKNRLHDYRKDLREKKEDIIQIIEDAEELITEINRFSEYTINQIEEKNQVLKEAMEKADLKIKLLYSSEPPYSQFKEVPQQSSYDEMSAHRKPKELEQKAMPQSSYDGVSVSKINNQIKSHEEIKPANNVKILSFGLKRREIAKLAKSGLDSTAIARILNCGKGEIELIARMGR